MGSFDSVVADCPNCGSQVEFQSKAGDCRGNIYTIDKVPTMIANFIDGDVEYCSCGCKLRIKRCKPKYEPMIVTYND
jgi:hypothetical protein